jgi:DNA-binding NtrC family response regulator
MTSQAPDRQAQGAPGAPESIHVLLVDDETRFLETLSRLLINKGLTVSTAASAEEALAVLEARRFDVVVLDVKLPGMQGPEALLEIRKKDPEVEVIILTGHASVSVARDVMRKGGAECLLKPCPAEVLLDKIGWAVERRKVRCAGRV